jgi:hypothetical protein
VSVFPVLARDLLRAELDCQRKCAAELTRVYSSTRVHGRFSIDVAVLCCCGFVPQAPLPDCCQPLLLVVVVVVVICASGVGEDLLHGES